MENYFIVQINTMIPMFIVSKQILLNSLAKINADLTQCLMVKLEVRLHMRLQRKEVFISLIIRMVVLNRVEVYLMEIQLHLKLLLLTTLIQKPFILERVKETSISGKAIHALNLQKSIKDQSGASNGQTVFCSLQEAKIVY
jgi:hypothetical protein